MHGELQPHGEALIFNSMRSEFHAYPQLLLDALTTAMSIAKHQLSAD